MADLAELALPLLDEPHHPRLPIGSVSYGGVAACRARFNRQPVVAAVRMMPVGASVNIPFVTQFLDQDGVIQGNDVMTQAAADMLDEFARVKAAPAPLRATG